MITERERLRKAKYRETHRAEIRERDKCYRQRNLEKFRIRDRDTARRKRALLLRGQQIPFPAKHMDPENHKAVQRKAWLRFAYGITPERVEEMLLAQGNKCYICKKVFGEKRKACVDHKRPNKVRAILCHPCNLVIGHAHEKPDILRSAAEYLELGMIEARLEKERPKIENCDLSALPGPRTGTGDLANAVIWSTQAAVHEVEAVQPKEEIENSKAEDPVGNDGMDLPGRGSHPAGGARGRSSKEPDVSCKHGARRGLCRHSECNR